MRRAAALDGKGSGGAYHVSSGADYSIKELFDATVAALRARPGARGRGARPQPGRRLHDPARPEPHAGRVRLEAEDAARGGRRRGDRVLPRPRHRARRSRTSSSSRRSSPRSDRPRRDQRPRRRRRRVRRLATSSATLLDRDAARVLVVDNLLSAERENVPDDPRVEFIEGSIADDAVLGARCEDELDYVFHLADLPRQPELDRRPARRPRAQHDHHAEALRADQGLRAPAQGRLRRVRLHAGAEDLRRGRGDAGGRRRSRSTSTARTRSPRSSASSTPSTTTTRHGLPTVRRASRTSTARARSSAPAAGAGRSTPSGATSRRRSSTGRSRACRCQLDNGGIAHRATSSTSATSSTG